MQNSENDKERLLETIEDIKKKIIECEELALKLARQGLSGNEPGSSLEEALEARTLSERIINKQLHSEIEQRKKLESELFERKQFLENIVNGIAEQIILVSKDFKILWANKTFLDQFGCKMKDLSGKYCYAVTHNLQSSCQPPHDTCPITKVLETGMPTKEIHTHHGPKGAFLSEVSAYPIKNEKGEIVEFVHIARNISEAKP
jgi:PAS domain S-box-containing protein